jgi:hypothetical protein
VFCATGDGLVVTEQVSTQFDRLKMLNLRQSLSAALLLAIVWTSCSLALVKRNGIPLPRVNDEFSYVLGADTFAHGRVLNPPHPFSRFFESPFVLVRPIYASMYPPGQALLLAAGQRWFGSPFYGVILESALLVFTSTLMLCAWVPARYALALAATFACCLLPPMYWSASYWGGSLAATGAALVLFSVALFRSQRMQLAAVLFALGCLLLSVTRMFEGSVFVLAVLLLFGREIWRAQPLRTAATAIPVLLLGLFALGYYNRALTGSAVRLPYLVYASQYDTVPLFWILPLRAEPAYSHPRLAAMHGWNGWATESYKFFRQPWWRGVFRGAKASVHLVYRILDPFALLVLLLPVPWREPRFLKLGAIVAICILTLTFETWHFLHYAAPAITAFLLMTAIWIQHTWSLRICKMPIGSLLVMLVLLYPAVKSLTGRNAGVGSNEAAVWTKSDDWPYRRAEMIQTLQHREKRQLVFVRYPSPEWDVGVEWVYNGADIDGQRVVFAHDLGSDENAKLLEYYRDREAWLVNVKTEKEYSIASYSLASH